MRARFLEWLHGLETNLCQDLIRRTKTRSRVGDFERIVDLRGKDGYVGRHSRKQFEIRIRGTCFWGDAGQDPIINVALAQRSCRHRPKAQEPTKSAAEVLLAISREFGKSLEWLLTGEEQFR